jgi:phosphoglycerate dehydrogenase-like enzyme
MTSTKTIEAQSTGKARQVADTVAGAAGEVTARIPEVAQGTRDVITEANRMVVESSDQTLKLVGTGAVGFALGMLLGGANRLFVVLSLVPASLIAATLLQRVEAESGSKPASRLQAR